jgi:hypothetical protein
MRDMDELADRSSDEDDREPRLAEMIAAFEAGEPVDLVRPARTLTVEYRYTDGRWHATSPDLTGFEVTGRSLHEIRQLVRADLADYLDPAVTLDERVPDDSETEGASRSQIMSGPTVITNPTSRSRSRVAVSQSRLVAA